MEDRATSYMYRVSIIKYFTIWRKSFLHKVKKLWIHALTFLVLMSGPWFRPFVPASPALMMRPFSGEPWVVEIWIDGVTCKKYHTCADRHLCIHLNIINMTIRTNCPWNVLLNIRLLIIKLIFLKRKQCNIQMGGLFALSIKWSFGFNNWFFP